VKISSANKTIKQVACEESSGGDGFVFTVASVKLHQTLLTKMLVVGYYLIHSFAGMTTSGMPSTT
jgi:hypothetical protein